MTQDAEYGVASKTLQSARGKRRKGGAFAGEFKQARQTKSQQETLVGAEQPPAPPPISPSSTDDIVPVLHTHALCRC